MQKEFRMCDCTRDGGKHGYMYGDGGMCPVAIRSVLAGINVLMFLMYFDLLDVEEFEVLAEEMQKHLPFQVGDDGSVFHELGELMGFSQQEMYVIVHNIADMVGAFDDMLPVH